MAKFEWFRRDSGEIMFSIVLSFIVLSFYVFRCSFNLIIMGVKGEFEILAEFSGVKLYIFSISPGLGLACIMACVLILGLPRVLHPRQ